jgi:GDPmannose 4,6-dehydratase
VYNLAAQSHVGESYLSPISTSEIDAIGPLNILEAIRNIDKSTRFYQASTSEMFGDIPGPQDETTPFSPVSPYACAKVFAHNMTATYRKSYDMYSCSGILFNHESPRRGENFVTRKITKAAARIKLGKQDVLELGNIDTHRDWGFAGDYVEAMWLMLQQDKPQDYVISTGETHTVREFVNLVFDMAGLDVNTQMRINPAFFRPHDVPHLLGNSTSARNQLGWIPKTNLTKLARMMYEQDLANEK